jgi:hypothetical protein
MANQGQLQTQQISASIGKQEAMNQKLSAKGAVAVDSLERGGDQWLQEKQMDRQATLLGMQMGASAGANLGAQNAAANEMQVNAEANSALAGSIGGAASGIGGAMSARQANPNDGTQSYYPGTGDEVAGPVYGAGTTQADGTYTDFESSYMPGYSPLDKRKKQK